MSDMPVNRVREHKRNENMDSIETELCLLLDVFVGVNNPEMKPILFNPIYNSLPQPFDISKDLDTGKAVWPFVNLL